jgi:hypothetical protein
MKIYCTTYCNQGHRVSDGKPVNHECRILPPAALVAEINGDYETAIALLSAEKNQSHMRRGVKE